MTKRGILIISHGSRDQMWVKQVDRTINEAKIRFYREFCVARHISLEEAEIQFPIVSSFLELVEGRLIQDGINTLQNKGVTHIDVLPLFVSAGSTHVEEIKQAFGFSPSYDFIGDLEPLTCHCKVNFDLPLIDDKEIVQIICRQLHGFNVNQLEQTTLMLIGHGSTHKTYYHLWEQGMEHLIDKVKQHFPALPMHYAALLPDNSINTLQALTMKYRHIIVIPLFISQGYFTHKVIPTRLDGLNYIYSGETLLPSEEMESLLVRRYQMLVK